MVDPHTTMSLTAVLVLTVVVLATVVGWLGIVFRVGAQPARRQARSGPADAVHAADPGSGPLYWDETAAHGAGDRV